MNERLNEFLRRDNTRPWWRSRVLWLSAIVMFCVSALVYWWVF